MLPINIDMNSFSQGKKQSEQQEKEQKQKKTASSMQATANRVVLGSLANNPNAGQITQQPAKQ